MTRKTYAEKRAERQGKTFKENVADNIAANKAKSEANRKARKEAKTKTHEEKLAAKAEKDEQKLADRPEMSGAKAHFDDMAFANKHDIPTIHPRLRFSRDGMIHFKGKTMPVQGCTATVETSGSVTRTGGFFIAHRRDDRVFLLTIDGPKGIFEVSIRAKNLAAETRVRKVARYINVTNKPGTDSDKLYVR